MTQSLWYKDAIIYQLHVKAFFDSNGDGFGDFNGLTEKLDYLMDLGVTAVWLLPFYPSPLRDDGYDIGDYCAIHRSYGEMRDFRRFVREAHHRGLRVITELVINHTSDQHKWFRKAREARPGSQARNMYVWSDTDQRYSGTRIIFTDTESSNWAWDPVAKAYYWHRFFSHQPDLNWDNPRVFDEITRVMKFWLDCGVDGMRLDAIPYLCERDGTNNENLPETHAVLKRLRAWLDDNFADRMFLAEANQWPEDVREYFGDQGDECHMAFHFPVMPRMYMALAQEDRHPITDIMRQTPEIPSACQWAIFLRNHDELTLEMVTDRERDYMVTFYARDPRARINVGIRRRLAPLLDNDRRKIELLNSLLMSMPGTPIVYYGDEIGMGDNIFLGDRDGVRTPMQWSPDRNGGFSRADPASLYLPPIMDSVYGFDAVNVEAQSRSPSSLLNWMRRLIAVRKRHGAFGRGGLRFLYPGNRKVLAYLREMEGEVILCVANLSRAPQAAELDLREFAGRVPVEMLGNSTFPPIGDLHYFITLPAYGFYWFLLTEGEAPAWHEPYVQAIPELATLVLPRGWHSLVHDRPASQLTDDILPAFLPNQRWFGAKSGQPPVIEPLTQALLPADDGGGAGDGVASGWLITLFRVVDGDPATSDSPAIADGPALAEAAQVYHLPLDIAWETKDLDPVTHLLPFTLARVRQGPRVGVLFDAVAGGAFAAAVVRAMVAGREVSTLPGAGGGGHLRFVATQALAAIAADQALPGPEEVSRLGREQSNTSLMVGPDMVLKVFRRLETGIHPEIEIGRYLTDVAGFANAPPLLGAVELVDATGTPTALAVLQGFVRNQGDGWDYILEYLGRFLEDRALLQFDDDERACDLARVHGLVLAQAEVLGRRVGDLHRAFALASDDPAFAPEPVTAEDLAHWQAQAVAQANLARRALVRALPTLPLDLARTIKSGLDRWHEIDARLSRPLALVADLVKTRIHGDLHLGQVVVVRDDFFILDFEGEPVRALDSRRRKQSPLRDVAGVLRSINYAGFAALSRHHETHGEGRGGLAALVEDWEARMSQTVLEGYRAVAGDCPSLPQEPESFAALLDLFILEKALYEIAYEAANRPAWLWVPVRGVARLMGWSLSATDDEKE